MAHGGEEFGLRIVGRLRLLQGVVAGFLG